MVMELPRRAETGKDLIYQEQCGCTATFFGASHWRTSRMDACLHHNKLHQTDWRNGFMDRARKERDWRLVNQPPV